MHQNQTPVNDRLEMSANVEGFKLPMGCLMISALILLAISAVSIGLFRVV